MVIVIRVLLEEYMNRIKSMDKKEYLFGVILYSAAPTVAGHKPASIITLSRDKGNLYSLWEKYKKEFLSEWMVEFCEIKKTENVITLLFYDSDQLTKVIYEEENMKFLYKFGYREYFSLEENLEVLKLRFEESFPHEIGLFLGIPLEDVICFIESPDKECLLCGYWKVYNNVEYAKESFSKYDTDKNTVINCVLQGILPSLVMRG